MKKLLIACISILPIISAGASFAYLFHEGTLDDIEPETFSVRYRSFRNPSGPMEIYLGYDSLRTGAVRSQTHVKYWGYGEDGNAVVFSYLPEQDRITTTVVSPLSGSRYVVFDRLSSYFSDPEILSRLNYLQIGVSVRDEGVMVTLSNVYLNGEYLGSFSAPQGTSGLLTWYLAGYDLSRGFTLTGNIVLHELNGKFTHRDYSMVDIVVGATPIPVPAALWLFGSGLAALAALRHKRRICNRIMRNSSPRERGD